MELLYRALPDESFWGERYELTADSLWMLPGSRDCPTCGHTWAMTGAEYPAVSLDAHPHQALYTVARAVPFEEFRTMRDGIRALFPASAYLPPGTSFGPRIGIVRGDIPDAVWFGRWTLLIREEFIRHLHDAGLRGFVGVPSPIKADPQDPGLRLVELHIEPGGQLSQQSYPLERRGNPCPTCGWSPHGDLQEIIVDGGSLSNDRDIFRARNHPTIILVTRRAVDVLSDLHLTNMLFEPVVLNG